MIHTIIDAIFRMLLQTFQLKIDQFTPINLILRQNHVQDNLHSTVGKRLVNHQRLVTAPPRSKSTTSHWPSEIKPNLGISCWTASNLTDSSVSRQSNNILKLDIQCIIIRWEAMMHQAAAVEAGADASCLRCASIPSIHLSVVATVTVQQLRYTDLSTWWRNLSIKW